MRNASLFCSTSYSQLEDLVTLNATVCTLLGLKEAQVATTQVKCLSAMLNFHVGELQPWRRSMTSPYSRTSRFCPSTRKSPFLVLKNAVYVWRKSPFHNYSDTCGRGPSRHDVWPFKTTPSRGSLGSGKKPMCARSICCNDTSVEVHQLLLYWINKKSNFQRDLWS